MTCLICRQAETVDGLTSIHFSRGEVRLIVNNVPARICPSCGEAYLAHVVAERLLQHAEKNYSSGYLDSFQEYQAI